MQSVSKDWLLVWNLECQELLGLLKAALEKERAAIVTLDFETIVSATAEKGSALNRLIEKKKHLRRLAQIRYGAESLDQVEEKLEEPLKSLWIQSYSTWKKEWESLVRLCEANQGFLTHSLKNMGFLLENLKQLFGQQGTYTPGGKRKTGAEAGKVIEQRY